LIVCSIRFPNVRHVSIATSSGCDSVSERPTAQLRGRSDMRTAADDVDEAENAQGLLRSGAVEVADVADAAELVADTGDLVWSWGT